jgi:hypothetical protein
MNSKIGTGTVLRYWDINAKKTTQTRIELIGILGKWLQVQH